MSRQLRWPSAPAEFNALSLPVDAVVLSARWWNLRWAAHLTPATVFHASLSGRLTPESGSVKCLYLAENPATSFAELYGDDLAAASEAGATFTLAQQDMVDRVFANSPLGIQLRLYDLTTEGSAKRIGMDLATLYTAEVERPRRFAQRLHDHPEKFDGVRYISRHTQRPCMVVWPIYTPALTTLSLARDSTLWDHAVFSAASRPGFVNLFGDTVGVAVP